ncbi:TPA: hypothetical protein ROY06_005453 [Bacillus cereus]|uniref:hypothetical protein n=1 Tax=Bacillus TaxID=1386 RepID=UPI001D0E4828|nr:MULTISPECIES: hypothetical protein [Bacillus]MCC2369431.1 hypothetical protein [Bacillus cereus]MCC2489962.1 hypothetical protein [Bacillus cereus]MCT1383533.1 hypothetical protein [Bacillus sp. p3-SID196]BCC62392.1 hypothetical protein BCJMU10_p219 [Bacillus cereus]HDX9512079.1 hypothetical protein [Bacillus cereus]
MKNILNSIDVDEHIGSVTLSNGKQLLLPKISMKKVIRIVKFIGVDGFRIYNQARAIMMDETIDIFEAYALILESLKEEQIIHILSILLDVSDEEALKLDPNETLEVLIEYADKTDLGKTFTLVRQLVKKMFNKELPDFKTLMDKWFPKVEAETPGPNLSKESSTQ